MESLELKGMAGQPENSKTIPEACSLLKNSVKNLVNFMSIG